MTRLIHQTDIFHPHGDPDDHWDLATVYALINRGRVDLKGVLLDYPPAHRVGDPALSAMAQIGHLAGVMGIPYAVGSMDRMRNRKDLQDDLDKRNLAAAEWLCRILECSDGLVSINIVGSCTDVALAGLMRPDLFEEKCKAVYLNAGAAHPGVAGEIEYNVRLNPSSYAAIFDLPCAVYWCPCWHQTEIREVGSNGSWYAFVQGDVFSRLSDPLCNYFLYMLSRSDDPKYLRYLQQSVDPNLRMEFGQKKRSMWSTAAIFHAGGMGVDMRKGLVASDKVSDPLFVFEPISIACADDGSTTWEKTCGESNRYIFQILHENRYSEAMQEALCQLLTGLGA